MPDFKKKGFLVYEQGNINPGRINVEIVQISSVSRLLVYIYQ